MLEASQLLEGLGGKLAYQENVEAAKALIDQALDLLNAGG